MSYEKKMKDLMARLVSMSPEPPPFPEEETPMARQREQRRSRPALVFAAAAALVIVLAVPLLLLDGGEVPPAATSTTTSTTVPPASTTTNPPSTTTTTPVPERQVFSGVVFLYAEPEDSVQSNPALVPVEMTVEAPYESNVDFTRALAALAESGSALPGDLINAIPPDVRLQALDEVGGQVGVDLNEAFLNGAGGLLADYTMLNQLIYTLTFFDPELEVIFTVDGAPVEAFGSEGLDLTEPVTRDSFINELGVIFLTQPLRRAGEAYVVEGMANVFEATLNVEVLDGEGNVVYDDFVSASSGTGTFGDFSATIPAEFITAGESLIRVFTRSAEDGSDIEVITVPIPDGGVWEYTVGG